MGERSTSNRAPREALSSRWSYRARREGLENLHNVRLGAILASPGAMRARIGTIIAGTIAAGIIAVGARFLVDPRGAARAYGVPLDSDADRWLTAVKGVRDMASGLVVAGAMALPGRDATRRMVALQTIIPIADGVIVATRFGARRPGFLAMHWGTAALMVVATALLR